jgi:replicative DNA helicase
MMSDQTVNNVRIPPQSIEAEMSVLGSMMQDSQAVSFGIEILDDSCFYKEAHRKVFSAIYSLYQRGEPVDILTVSNELAKQKELDAIGGHYFLTELIQRIPSAANVQHYSRIVLDKALLRKLISISNEIQNDCFEAAEESTDIIDRAEQKIFTLSEKRVRRDFEHIKPILHTAVDIMERNHQREGGLTGITTGFKSIDNLLSGLQNSEFIIIAARPSMGKTALALNIARNAAVAGVPVGVFSLEMSAFQLAARMVCAEARIDSHKVRSGKLPQPDWDSLVIAASVLSELPLFIDDTPGINIMELRSKARRLKIEKDVKLIVVDYLQLVRGVGRIESRQVEISTISQALKNLSKELNIPVLALSQLSRAVESRGGDRKPMLSDLRESGAIEQDADVVMFIFRPAAYMPGQIEPELEHHAELIVAKQRNGPIGNIELIFLKDFVLFAEKEVFIQELPKVSSDLF